MQFDKEQMQQLREAITDVVVTEIQASEKRVITSVTMFVGEMVEDNILPQFQDIRQDISEMKTDIAGLKTDMAVVKYDVAGLKYDVGHLKQDMAGMRNGRWQFAG